MYEEDDRSEVAVMVISVEGLVCVCFESERVRLSEFEFGGVLSQERTPRCDL